MRSIRLLLATLASVTAAAVAVVGAQGSPQGDDGFRFKSGVELVNVTATVSDDNGHFVTGLTKDDFNVYEDGQPQDISQVSNERVPVSLGILLDTSGSMTPAKMSSYSHPLPPTRTKANCGSAPAAAANASISSGRFLRGSSVPTCRMNRSGRW